jgi:exportin-5
MEEFEPLVALLYQVDHLVLLRKLYEWTAVDATDIDETRYQISKKLSEVFAIRVLGLEFDN